MTEKQRSNRPHLKDMWRSRSVLGVIVKNLRRLTVLMIGLLIIPLTPGCRTLDEKEELPTNPNVRVLVFPVRSLRFANVSCTQEGERLKLSGSVKNISPWTLSNLQIHADIIYPGETSRESIRVPVRPSPLQPGDSGNFSLSGEVHHPIRHVELHTLGGRPESS